MANSRKFNGHTFTLSEDCFECRGERYFDDEHDQVPEPSLQIAAEKLQEALKLEGKNSEIEFGEKGWIEVNLID